MNECVPVADPGLWLLRNLSPVLFPRFMADVLPDKHPPDFLVSGESVVAHHTQLQRQVLEALVAKIKLESLVEDDGETVRLYQRLPLFSFLPLVHQVYFYIDFCIIKLYVIIIKTHNNSGLCCIFGR